MIRIIVFIVRLIKGIVILTLPVLMIYSMVKKPIQKAFF